ncbi:MAG: DUF5652 family protein [Microgenomates group bacterium]
MDKLAAFFASPANQPLIVILMVADLILRGIALYKSARQEQKIWFIALLIVNSVGILPLIYLLLEKKATTKVSHKKPTKKVKR